MDSHRLHFETLPSLGKFYRQALFSRKPGLRKGSAIPSIEASASPLVPDGDHVDLYRRVCGLQDDGYVPLCYPHVLAAPLHFAILMSKPSPIKALGLVHVSNDIVGYRPIRPDEALEVVTWVEGPRDAPRGLLFDLKTRIHVREEVVWESISTIIRIQKSSNSKGRATREQPMPGIAASPHRTSIWGIGEDTGRRYARPSGDFNPIHLSALSAKLFGFKRAIAHGMWGFARCLGECAEDLPEGAIHAQVTFKRPIFLPSRVLFTSYVDGKGLDLGLHSVDGSKPHLAGSVHPFVGSQSFL